MYPRCISGLGRLRSLLVQGSTRLMLPVSDTKLLTCLKKNNSWVAMESEHTFRGYQDVWVSQR
jgi:hypothetical protein